jgi:hypothetical protein
VNCLFSGPCMCRNSDLITASGAMRWVKLAVIDTFAAALLIFAAQHFQSVTV